MYCQLPRLPPCSQCFSIENPGATHPDEFAKYFFFQKKTITKHNQNNQACGLSEITKKQNKEEFFYVNRCKFANVWSWFNKRRKLFESLLLESWNLPPLVFFPFSGFQAIKTATQHVARYPTRKQLTTFPQRLNKEVGLFIFWSFSFFPLDGLFRCLLSALWP